MGGRRKNKNNKGQDGKFNDEANPQKNVNRPVVMTVFCSMMIMIPQVSMRNKVVGTTSFVLSYSGR